MFAHHSPAVTSARGRLVLAAGRRCFQSMKRLQEPVLLGGWVVGITLMGICLLRFPVSVAVGSVFYVGASGSDSNSCSKAQSVLTPKRTLSNAVSCLTSGDTLYIRGGTYTEALLDDIPSGSSWNSPVTVAAYSGETVTLIPNSGLGWVLHFQNGQQYIVIDGLVLDGSNVTYDVVKITYGGSNAVAAHHIRIKNTEIKNARCAGQPGPDVYCQGILLTAGPGGGGDYNEFINDKIHDNGVNDFSHGIYMSTNNNLIDGCEVYRNGGWGLHLFVGPRNNIVRNNNIHHNAWAGKRGPGIGIYGSDNLVYNNVVWNNRGGIQLDCGGPGCGGANGKIFNNTIYNNNANGAGVGILLNSNNSNTLIENNIVYQHSAAEIYTGDSSGTAQSNNLVGTDPQFVNAPAGDFHLQARSPAIGSGTALTEVPADLDGVPRPPSSAYDVGAYQQNGRPAAISIPRVASPR